MIMTERDYIDVVALGELLVDMTQCGLSPQGRALFEANPGGAPANVLAMLSKLGKRTAFIGKVGEDSFGHMLADTLRELNIDTGSLFFDREIPTTLALVSNKPDGDRDFSFYRKPGADVMLTPEDLRRSPLRSRPFYHIFHFGTLSLAAEPCRSATIMALEQARRDGALLSFDPNLRLPLWSDPEDAREWIRWGIRQCDVLKIADNELDFLSSCASIDEGCFALSQLAPQLRLILITAGAKGSYAWVPGLTCADLGSRLRFADLVFEPAVSRGGVVDTTGAGDTFCASVLNFLLEQHLYTPSDLARLDEAALRRMLRFANAAAYLVTTKRGAIPAMPDRSAVEALLAGN